MKTIEIRSSHGSLTVNARTGEVILCHEFPGSEGELSHIATVDLKEHIEHHNYPNNKIPYDSVDILDVGFWTKGGNYTEPEHDWRKFTKQHIADDSEYSKKKAKYSNLLNPPKEFENPTIENAVYLVKNMPEDLVESRTSYDELKEMFTACVYHIINNN